MGEFLSNSGPLLEIYVPNLARCDIFRIVGNWVKVMSGYCVVNGFLVSLSGQGIGNLFWEIKEFFYDCLFSNFYRFITGKTPSPTRRRRRGVVADYFSGLVPHPLRCIILRVDSKPRVHNIHSIRGYDCIFGRKLCSYGAYN